jgi:hypothetical protein
MFGLVVILALGIWAAVDARRMEARFGIGVVEFGPTGLFFLCVLLRVVGFPLCLVERSGRVARWCSEPVVVELRVRSDDGTGAVGFLDADEFMKLLELRDLGALTDDGSHAHRARILALRDGATR